MKIKYIGFLIVIVLLASLIFFSDKLVKIKHIECITQYGICPAEINDLLPKDEVSYEQLKNIVNSNFSENKTIESFSLQYKPLDRVEIYVILDKPIYALRKSASDTAYLVNSNGYILSTSDTTNLPVLIYSEADFQIGDVVKDRVLFALSLVYNVSVRFDLVNARLDDSLTLEFAEGTTVLMPTSGEVGLLVGKLIYITSGLKGDNEVNKIERIGKIIDLRFKNPVIR